MPFKPNKIKINLSIKYLLFAAYMKAIVLKNLMKS